MGAYSSVFEFRWLGWKNRDIPEIRGHTLALTFWIDLAATMAFHDPDLRLRNVRRMEGSSCGSDDDRDKTRGQLPAGKRRCQTAIRVNH